jgi:hydroxyethylthiazole kinase
LKLSVIRGNISEIKFVAGLSSQTKGVDASDSDIAGADSAGQTARALARKLGCVVVISGVVDTISDGAKIILVENGHPMLGNLTGTGCMCSSLIGSFCGAAPEEPLAAAAAAMMCMGIAGELAYESIGQRGNGSFRVALHDAVSRMDAATLEKLARYHEA